MSFKTKTIFFIIFFMFFIEWSIFFPFCFLFYFNCFLKLKALSESPTKIKYFYFFLYIFLPSIFHTLKKNLYCFTISYFIFIYFLGIWHTASDMSSVDSRVCLLIYLSVNNRVQFLFQMSIWQDFCDIDRKHSFDI